MFWGFFKTDNVWLYNGYKKRRKPVKPIFLKGTSSGLKWHPLNSFFFFAEEVYYLILHIIQKSNLEKKLKFEFLKKMRNRTVFMNHPSSIGFWGKKVFLNLGCIYQLYSLYSYHACSSYKSKATSS